MAGRRHAATASNIRDLTARLSADNTPESPLVANLQRQVANAFVIYTNYKHYHWQTYGPMFRDLHLLFDEFAHDVLETIDKLAERVRMIGQDPVGHLTTMVEMASVSASVESQPTMQTMIQEGQKNA